MGRARGRKELNQMGITRVEGQQVDQDGSRSETVLVSGATGFMGGAVTRHLLSAGFSVRALSRSAERARGVISAWPGATKALAEGRLSFVSGDVTDPDTLPAAVEDVDLVIQAAQFPGAPVEDPKRGYTYANVDRDGTINLLEAIARVYGDPSNSRAPRFAYLSGAGVEPETSFPWVKAKLEAERACKASGLEWCIVRPSWAYGPGDRSLNRLLGYTRFLPFLPFFGDGEALVSPVFAEDVGRLLALVAAHPERAGGRTLALGGPAIVTLNSFLRTALEVTGRTRPILHIPLGLGRAQGAIMQYLPGRPLTPGAVDFVAHGAVGDLRALQEVFPEFSPLPMRAALSSYLGPPAGEEKT
jgi:NADH dehydrogenase